MNKIIMYVCVVEASLLYQKGKKRKQVYQNLENYIPKQIVDSFLSLQLKGGIRTFKQLTPGKHTGQGVRLPCSWDLVGIPDK